MSDSRTVLPRTPKRIGVAADHGGFESKEYLVGRLGEAHYEVVTLATGSRTRMMTIQILLCL